MAKYKLLGWRQQAQVKINIFKTHLLLIISFFNIKIDLNFIFENLIKRIKGKI